MALEMGETGQNLLGFCWFCMSLASDMLESAFTDQSKVGTNENGTKSSGKVQDCLKFYSIFY